ncbi:MAG: pentapeptide repeat-containing protein [Sedimentisphaerales bacterium]|nr:pentapeptide repeat-containing protein [Sedimentisphaerales bacterium]
MTWIMLLCAANASLGDEGSHPDTKQYEMLVRCSKREGADEWNQWREANPAEAINLQQADLTDMRFGGFDLRSSDLKGASLDKAQFIGANLRGANLQNTSLDETHFTRADFTDASLRDASGIGPHFEGADLTRADLQGTVLEPAYFDGALLSLSNLRKAQLKNARMSSVRLLGATLSFANLECATLAGAEITEADLAGSCLDGADMSYAAVTDVNMTEASCTTAQLTGARIIRCSLERASLGGSVLAQTLFVQTDLRGADFRMAMVDGTTCFLDCRFDGRSDFRGVGLGNVRMPERYKTYLEQNIRKLNWEDWYKTHPWQEVGVRSFWWISDYGYSTWRIVWCFVFSAVVFAATYGIWGMFAPPGLIQDQQELCHFTPAWRYYLVRILRPFYFSVVTMTTLGFGDIRANPKSVWGHIIVTSQVIWGYFLLGAIVTRLGILFTSGGPGL